MSSTPPQPSPYTYTDEQWRVHTVYPKRLYSCSKVDGRIIRPGRAPRGVSLWKFRVGPCTQAEKAAEADEALWASCDSVEEYEARKWDLAAAAQLVYEQNQETFHPFIRLPMELRLRVWEFAMEEPTRITVTGGRHGPRRKPRGSRCGTVSLGPPKIHAIKAMMPPLMLVNRETNYLASRHYRRAFRGAKGGGGVLAAYPSILSMDNSTLWLIPEENLDMVSEIVIVCDTKCIRWSGYLAVFRKLLKLGFIRRLEIRLPSPVSREEAGGVRDRIGPAFSALQAENPEWVAPELCVGPVKDGEDIEEDEDDD